MSRLTIILDNDLHRALKETATRQGRSIASMIEESLRLRGIQDQANARALVAQARKRANLIRRWSWPSRRHGLLANDDPTRIRR